MENDSNFDEWIPLSDMLACCVAVLLMIILIIEQRPSINKLPGTEGLKEALMRIEGESENGKIYFVDGGDHYKLVLSTESFELGSPMIKDNIRDLIISAEEKILSTLIESSIIIRVEGHADAKPLYSSKKLSVVNPKPHKTYQYNYDNVLLSLQRAMEVKQLLVDKWARRDISDTVREKVSVSGYGSNRPVNRKKPLAAENRRVEIYFE